MEYPSDEECEEEYEGEQNDNPQDEEENDDPQDEEEDYPQEEEMPDDDGSLAHSVHSAKPDSPIHPLEPVSPDHPFLFDSPPGSPVASDTPSEVSAEHAESGETGRMWAQITAQGERISRMSNRLEMIMAECMTITYGSSGAIVIYEGRRVLAITILNNNTCKGGYDL
jgi:hypothetical protein